jgi:anti-sigma factor ChrR (cupin superfamily)
MNMKVRHPQDDSRELAALYALGVMSPEASRNFEDHLADGCVTCRNEAAAMGAVVGDLGLMAPEAAPPPSLRGRILNDVAREVERRDAHGFQVWKTWEATNNAPGPMYLVRSEGGGWVDTGVDGVAVRRLFVDPLRRQVTMLIRMSPGTSYPPHRHGGVEECYVLQGDLRVDDVLMQAGDYQRVDTGGIHPVQSTDGGCLLFITSSMEDEILT